MNIDLLITELEPGGAERCCTALALYAQAQGHSVRVISLDALPVRGRDQLVLQLEAGGIAIHALDETRQRSPLAIRSRLRKLVSEKRPDVAQGFLWHANMLGASVYPKFSIPFFAGVRVADPRRWRSWLSRYWVRRSTKVVCVSDAVAQWSHRFEGTPESKRIVIPNGIAPIENRLSFVDPRAHASDRILLFVGRLADQKGVLPLMGHADALLKSLPEHRLVLLGDGPLMDDVRKLATASPFRERIDVLGHRDDAANWMAHCECLLHPARYEGMPNVVLEAMAFGKPVVAFDVEGVRELLGPAFTSQGVPVGDWETWIQKAILLAGDRSLQETVGAGNRDRVTRLYALDDQLAKYLRLWTSATSVQARRRQ